MTDAVPPWADEKAEVLPYDPRWAQLAASERARLAGLLEPLLAGGVQHVGSTSVPRLAAKPVIDLMASVRDPAAHHAHDREAYTDAKAQFVADALRHAARPDASRPSCGSGP
jgi:GrpB-like predicted nucleotidyltransferase (UPF0157 family)